jgi:hypothetical protein
MHRGGGRRGGGGAARPSAGRPVRPGRRRAGSGLAGGGRRSCAWPGAGRSTRRWRRCSPSCSASTGWERGWRRARRSPRAGLRSVDLGGVAMVCVCYLEIGGSPAHLRRLLRRLRQQAPQAPLLPASGRRRPRPHRPRAARRGRADHYATSLREAVEACIQEARRACGRCRARAGAADTAGTPTAAVPRESPAPAANGRRHARDRACVRRACKIVGAHKRDFGHSGDAGPRTPGVRPHRMTRNAGRAQCAHTADPCNKASYDAHHAASARSRRAARHRARARWDDDAASGWCAAPRRGRPRGRTRRRR